MVVALGLWVVVSPALALLVGRLLASGDEDLADEAAAYLRQLG